ncbi:META domain-containing protein [Paenimyroides baculatum]|uniref:META domain-containing protein n=1 Tax=Paenimyroides baculatum TaxID=2608000 RepID=A0A5M6CH86_9FLAO|nr:META domain-containing protein [Paenimyroides baculatum]KAA5532775.1 META domain-containing protein [Paenimyroides baculatum]
MLKKIILFITLFIFMSGNCQLYQQVWGSMLPIYTKQERPFSPIKKILSTPYITEVNPNTGNLYVVAVDGRKVVEYQQLNAISKSIYKNEESDPFSIESLKFDYNNDLIISGKTLNPNLSTSGAYIQKILQTNYSISSFVAKITLDGTIKWFTYFYDIPQNTISTAVDKDNNIYVLNRRSKTDVVSPSYFQETGDPNTIISHQDVITKLDQSGKHVWSTFYAKDQSKINAIIAGDKGLYVYGMHLANNNASSYFGTSGSFLEKTSATINNTSSVFLSKFGFDGVRLWSTYFGNEKSHIPFSVSSTVKNHSNMTVINDDVYFITGYNSFFLNNHATNNVFLDKPYASSENQTLSKFSGEGSRLWTTYLPMGGYLQKSLSGDKLFISTTVDQKRVNNILLATQNAYQFKSNGAQDIYTYSLSVDGKTLEYGSFYGFEGNDAGYSIPTFNGYYTIGHAKDYSDKKSFFATEAAPLKEFTFIDEGVYIGNFLSYFSEKEKSVEKSIWTFIDGKKWKLIKLNDWVDDFPDAYIQFDLAEKKASGNNGCNDFTGIFKPENERALISNLHTKRKKCKNDASSEIQTSMMKYLNDEELRFDVADQTLNFYKDNQLVMIFGLITEQ